LSSPFFVLAVDQIVKIVVYVNTFSEDTGRLDEARGLFQLLSLHYSVLFSFEDRGGLLGCGVHNLLIISLVKLNSEVK
jgi:hypothetical protein